MGIPQPDDKIPLEGSESAPVAGSRIIGPADPQEQAEITVRVRHRSSERALPSPEALGAMLPKDRTYISREDFDSEYGADPDDVEKVKSFARNDGLNVERVDAAQRTVVLSGPVHELSRAFGVDLNYYASPQGRYRGYTGTIHVPSELAGIIEDVSGLDDRLQARRMEE